MKYPPNSIVEWAAANGHRMYNWSDDNGNVTYWDAMHSACCPCYGDEPLPDW